MTAYAHQFPSESKISFVRDEIDAGAHPVVALTVLPFTRSDLPLRNPQFKRRVMLAPCCYRMTVAYRTDAVEREAPERDPAFVVTCGLAFCDAFGSDTFTQEEGRAHATEHLKDSPFTVRVYVGQQVLAAVYTALAKRTPSQLRALHVPRRLIPTIRRMRRMPLPEASPKRVERQTHSRSARRLYNSLVASGKTREEAIALCKMTAKGA